MKHIKKNSPTDIVNRIGKHIKKEKVSPALLAAPLGIRADSVTVFLKKQYCDVDRLWDISKALNYNFFTGLAKEININQPKLNEPEELIQLRKEVYELRLELKHLKEFIKLSAAK